MRKYRCWTLILIACLCLSLTACDKPGKDIYEQFDGITEGEFGISEISESADSEAEENPADASLNYDTVGGGVSVFAAQNASYEDSTTWYPNKNIFLSDYGFYGQEPFYEYYDISGRPLMVLYYDAETDEGCGLRYYPYASDVFPEGDGIFGFTFQGSRQSEWTGFMVADYLALTSVYGGNGSQAVNEYTENVEMDEEGRVIHFEAQGIVPELAEMGYADPQTILSMEFAYHENGNLKSRDYEHSHYVFPTSLSSLQTYFDELGRPVYENGYSTHGSLDYYYIYVDDSNIPGYYLTLDFMNGAWMPTFVEYIVPESEN